MCTIHKDRGEERQFFFFTSSAPLIRSTMVVGIEGMVCTMGIEGIEGMVGTVGIEGTYGGYGG